MSNLSRCWLSCFGPWVSFFRKAFNIFSFHICWLWAYEDYSRNALCTLNVIYTSLLTLPLIKPGNWAVIHMYVRGIDLVSDSIIFLWDIGIVLTVCYFVHFNTNTKKISKNNVNIFTISFCFSLLISALYKYSCKI
jgi:hypothetical protein